MSQQSQQATPTPAPSTKTVQPAAGATTKTAKLGDGTTDRSLRPVKSSRLIRCHSHHSRQLPHLRSPRRQHNHMLGQQPKRTTRRRTPPQNTPKSHRHRRLNCRPTPLSWYRGRNLAPPRRLNQLCKAKDISVESDFCRGAAASCLLDYAHSL